MNQKPKNPSCKLSRRESTAVAQAFRPAAAGIGPLVLILLCLAVGPAAFAQNGDQDATAQRVEVATVASGTTARNIRLPGELSPYQRVAIFARVASFVETMHVDRGSVVRKGQPLVTLSAPELEAQIAESQAKSQAVELQLAEARAKLVSAQTTHEMLKNASETPGAVSVVELTLADQAHQAAQAVVEAVENSARAARSAADAMARLGAYLQMTAPFDGIVTERMAHPGALVGPGTGGVSAPLLYLEQNSRLRLTVAVPEVNVAGIERGAKVSFIVPAHQGDTFEGTVSRISQSLDARTRSMAVEVDVQNRDGRLTAGMYADVDWPIRMTRTSLLVPPSSVVVTTERSFVIRLQNGKAEWVPVTRGATVGDAVEVYGPLQAGDVVVRRGTDEIREGTQLAALR